MTGPIKAPADPKDVNTSTTDGITITENNKYKGSLAVEAFDGLVTSINAEAESTVEQAVDISFSAIGAVASVVSVVADPFGQIFGTAVGWLIEHVDPLKECLDKLTGNPDEVMQNSEDTKAHAGEMRILAEDHKQMMANFTGWEGQSSEGYRASMEQLGTELDKMADATELKAKIVSIAGMIVQVARDIIRDMIAEFIGKLIARLIEMAIAAAITFGLAAPALIARAIADIAAFVGTLLSRIAKVVNALRKLAAMIPKLDEALKMLSKAWDRFDNVADAAEISYEAYNAAKDVDEKVDEKVDEDDKQEKKDEEQKADKKVVDDANKDVEEANEDYKEAKDTEAQEGKEAQEAGETVNKEAKEAEEANEDVQDAADDAEKYAKEAEAAAKRGDQEAYDAAMAKYEKAMDRFDDAKAIADKENQDVVDASKVLADETQDVADAAKNSEQALDNTKAPTAAADEANQKFADKYATPESELPPEQVEGYRAEKAAAEDLDAKNDVAKADQYAYEKASSEASQKNADAAAANAKAIETGDPDDIAAADKANKDAEAANKNVETAAEKSQQSGKDAEDAHNNYKTIADQNQAAAPPQPVEQAPVQAL